MYVYKYSVDIYLLCMRKFRVRWCIIKASRGYYSRAATILLSSPVELQAATKRERRLIEQIRYLFVYSAHYPGVTADTENYYRKQK